MRSHRLVVVFARLPRDERREKPLVVGARGERIEALHHALLERAIAAALATGADVRLVTTGAPAPSLVQGGVQVAQQEGATFAERLERAVADGFRDGWQEVAVIGSDSALLDATHIRDAFAALEGARGPKAAIGPTVDGGYYLLALNRFIAAPFRHGALCTNQAGARTALALQSSGVEVTALTVLRDVDDVDDVRVIARDGGTLGRLARQLLATSAPSTRSTTPTSSRFTEIPRLRGPPTLS